VSASVKYGAAAVAVVGLGTLALWPFLEPAARRGVLVAAVVALPVQLLAFAVLLRFRGRVKGFVAAWAGGMAVRALALGAVAFFVIRSGGEGVVATLLALAGFFFALNLLEPVYFRPEPTETA
jgi:hypothetical protein